MAYCLAISGGYRFSPRGYRFSSRLGVRLATAGARHLRGLPLQFQERLLLWLVEDSPSPGATASVPGDSYAGRLRCLAISRGYCFTLDGVTPKTAKRRMKSGQYTVASA